MQQKRTPKAPIQIIDWSLAKEEREHIGEKIVFPANGAGSTGYLHTKKKKVHDLQAALSMGLSRQEYCPLLLQEILPSQGSNPCLLRLLTLAARLFTTEPPGKPISFTYL